jgi:phosphocarrier protein HPr
MQKGPLVKECSSSVKPSPANAPALTRTLVLENRLGLHARPAALLVKNMLDYKAQVQVTCEGELANGRSILGLLSLAAGYGSKLTFSVSGPDAASAMEAIQRLFDTNFEEAY